VLLFAQVLAFIFVKHHFDQAIFIYQWAKHKEKLNPYYYIDQGISVSSLQNCQTPQSRHRAKGQDNSLSWHLSYDFAANIGLCW